LRNGESDAHGKSPEDNYDTEKEDALLVLNLVKSISEFILVKFEKNKNVKSEINIFLDL